MKPPIVVGAVIESNEREREPKKVNITIRIVAECEKRK